MVMCQGDAPSCSWFGECEKDGWCFGRDGSGFKAARRKIAKAIEGESSVFVRSWLKLALDALDQHQFLSGRALNAMRYVQINKAVRKQYGITE